MIITLAIERISFTSVSPIFILGNYSLWSTTETIFRSGKCQAECLRRTLLTFIKNKNETFVISWNILFELSINIQLHVFFHFTHRRSSTCMTSLHGRGERVFVADLSSEEDSWNFLCSFIESRVESKGTNVCSNKHSHHHLNQRHDFDGFSSCSFCGSLIYSFQIIFFRHRSPFSICVCLPPSTSHHLINASKTPAIKSDCLHLLQFLEDGVHIKLLL